jgi:hypothetical protein
MKLKKKKGWADRRLTKQKVNRKVEHLVGCTIERDNAVHGIQGNRHHSHASVRASMGDTDIYNERPGDVHGFLTSEGRIVGRLEASTVAVLAGQAAPMYEGRSILSSDINWRL